MRKVAPKSHAHRKTVFVVVGDNDGGGHPYDHSTMESEYQAMQDEDHEARDPLGRYYYILICLLICFMYSIDSHAN